MLGASGVIYGLLALCLVWAPRNDLNCLAFFHVVPYELDIPILWFAVLYIGLEVVILLGTGFSITSALAHAGGALAGFALGVAILKAKLVECENWDLFAVIEGRQGQKSGRTKARRAALLSSHQSPRKRALKKSQRADATKLSFEDPSAAAIRRLRGHLELGEIEAALGVYEKSRKRFAPWPLPERDRIELIKALLDHQMWDDLITVMTSHVEEADDPSPRIRLKLAQLLMEKQGRPARALRVLAALPESLSESLQTIHRQLVQQAEQMREDGVLELEDET
jgi:hypothetical protein